MIKKNIENYDKPKIPNKGDFFSANNIVSVISIGLLTITLSCSSNVKIIEKETNSSDSLLTNYPNPFMPTKTIKYLIEDTDKTRNSVKVTIYNNKGDLVRNLFNGFQLNGEYNLEWNGKNDNDESVSSGIYFYKIEINEKQEVKKMLLLK